MNWTVTKEKMALTTTATSCTVCLSAGLIVTDDVIEGPNSLVIPEAGKPRDFCRDRYQAHTRRLEIRKRFHI